MMDHTLQMISYIADIDDIVVLMARRKLKGPEGGVASCSSPSSSSSKTQNKCIMICHVFSSKDVRVLKKTNVLCWASNGGSEMWCLMSLAWFSSLRGPQSPPEYKNGLAVVPVSHSSQHWIGAIIYGRRRAVRLLFAHLSFWLLI